MKMKLSEKLFQTKLLSRLSHMFAVFVPLPSCCVSFLISNLKTSGITLSQFPPYLSFA